MMLQFDPESIAERIINNMKVKLQAKYGEVKMLFFGTNRRIIEAFAEEEAELARYAEVLMRETKWSLARNVSSILSQADFFNYKAHRLIGARGTVRVSANSAFNGTYPIPIPIPKWTAFQGGSKFFIVEQDVTLLNSQNYIEVPICEGIVKTESFEITPSIYPEGTSYLTITLDNNKVENSFLEVRVNGLLYSQITDIRLSGSGSEQVYVEKNSLNYKQVYFTFGNGIFGRKLEYGDVVQIKYVETSGPAGEVISTGILTKPVGQFQDSSSNIVTIYSTNTAPIVNGDTYETLESIRANAPLSYQNSGRAITKNDYASLINKSGIVDRIIIWGEAEVNEDNGDPPGTYIPPEENLVRIAGFNISLSGFGTTLSAGEQSQIRTLLNDLKGPTDILKFVDTEFVYLRFKTTAAVNDRRYSLDTVKANVFNGLKDKYSLYNVEFKENLFFSQYQQYIQSLAGVFYHTTTVSFTHLTKFTSAYIFFARFNINSIKPNSVKIYIRSATIVNWKLLASDDGSTNIVGAPIDPNNLGAGYYTLPSARIDYADGRLYGGPDGSVIVTSGLLELYSNYEIRIDYDLTDSENGDVKLTKRNQIYSFYDAEVNSFLYDPIGAI